MKLVKKACDSTVVSSKSVPGDILYKRSKKKKNKDEELMMGKISSSIDYVLSKAAAEDKPAKSKKIKKAVGLTAALGLAGSSAGLAIKKARGPKYTKTLKLYQTK